MQVLADLASSSQTAGSLLRTPDASPIRCILKLVLLRSRIAYKFSHLVSETFLILFLHQFGGKNEKLVFQAGDKKLCTLCGKRFSYSSQLQVHMSVHHKDEADPVLLDDEAGGIRQNTEVMCDQVS